MDCRAGMAQVAGHGLSCLLLPLVCAPKYCGCDAPGMGTQFGSVMAVELSLRVVIACQHYCSLLNVAIATQRIC